MTCFGPVRRWPDNIRVIPSRYLSRSPTLCSGHPGGRHSLAWNLTMPTQQRPNWRGATQVAEGQCAGITQLAPGSFLRWQREARRSSCRNPHQYSVAVTRSLISVALIIATHGPASCRSCTTSRILVPFVGAIVNYLSVRDPL